MPELEIIVNSTDQVLTWVQFLVMIMREIEGYYENQIQQFPKLVLTRIQTVKSLLGAARKGEEIFCLIKAL